MIQLQPCTCNAYTMIVDIDTNAFIHSYNLDLYKTVYHSTSSEQTYMHTILMVQYGNGR